MDSSKLAPAPQSSPAEERTVEQRRRSDAEKWAALLAGGVVEACREPVAPAPPDAGSPPKAWRPGDGGLTPGGSGPSASAGAAQSAPREAPRVAMRLDAGDLGEIAVIVDRSGDGVRVVIGVPDARAERAVEPERRLLEQALAASGISVESVRVVHHHRMGTVLAPRTTRQRAAGTANASAGATSPLGSNPRPKRRLNLIG